MALDYGEGSTERILTSDGRRDDVPRPEEPKYIVLVNGRYETRSRSRETIYQLVVVGILTEPMTQAEILKAWPKGERKIGRSTLQDIMNAGVADGVFSATGKGVSGNPRRYEVGQFPQDYGIGTGQPTFQLPSDTNKGGYSVDQPRTQGVGKTGRPVLDAYHNFNNRVKSARPERVA